jgi:hypothetical protein
MTTETPPSRSPLRGILCVILALTVLAAFAGGYWAYQRQSDRLVAAEWKAQWRHEELKRIALWRAKGFLYELHLSDYQAAGSYVVIPASAARVPAGLDVSPEDLKEFRRSIAAWLESRVTAFLEEKCPEASRFVFHFHPDLTRSVEFTDPDRPIVRVEGDMGTDGGRAVAYELMVRANNAGVTIVGFKILYLHGKRVDHVILPYTPD